MKSMAETEDRARAVLRRAAVSQFMELESLAVDRESNRVFIVLKGPADVENRTGIGYGSTAAGRLEA